MKKMKKFLAMLLAAVMVMGMSVTALATEEGEEAPDANPSSAAASTQTDVVNGYPSEDDHTTVTITGLEGLQDGTVVTLYKIASALYADNGFDRYEFAEGTGVTVENAQAGLTATQITAIVNGLKAAPATVTPYKTYTTAGGTTQGTINTAEKTYTCDVEAGVYIAIVTGAKNAIYNPILLTATYDAEGKLAGGTIDAGSKYLFGSTAVAKSMTPDIDKTVTGGEADKMENGSEEEDVITASLGTRLTYTLTPTMPEYPVNSVNKALFISDSMSKGLTFLPDTLKVTVNGTEYKADADGWLKKADTDSQDASIGKIETTPATGNSGAKFVINLKYEKLRTGNEDGSVYTPVVTYDAVINENAVYKNDNEASLVYSTDSSTTPEWDENTVTPPTGEGYDHQEDTETVYTYELAFHKIGVDTDADKLKDAVFGIYSNAECTELVDVVKTNAEGYAVSSQVGKGDYYIKEIQAPAGYSLNDRVYKVTAQWSASETTFIVTDVKRVYTSDASEAISSVQAGWLSAENVFYGMDITDTTGLIAAYIKSETMTTDTDKETVETEGKGTVTDIVEIGEDGTEKPVTDIPNTKLASLPSTGGIGTTIFTIGGCAIMIIAAALFFATRRKAEK